MEDCRRDGFITSLFCRRRLFPDINSNSNEQRAASERGAVNSVCQASAADLVKCAMVALSKQMSASEFVGRVRMVLMVRAPVVVGALHTSQHLLQITMEDAAQGDKNMSSIKYVTGFSCHAFSGSVQGSRYTYPSLKQVGLVRSLCFCILRPAALRKQLWCISAHAPNLFTRLCSSIGAVSKLTFMRFEMSVACTPCHLSKTRIAYPCARCMNVR